MIPLARFVPSSRGWAGRPSKDRLAIASAFVAQGRVRIFSRQTVVECGGRRHPTAADLRLGKGQFHFGEFARMELPQFPRLDGHRSAQALSGRPLPNRSSRRRL
jgi:hypothetical protein